MMMSDLAEATGVPVATLKYYLREGLLPRGRVVTSTRSLYDDAHVARVRLIRTLRETADLGIGQISRVLRVLDDAEAGPVNVMRAAQRALPLPGGAGSGDDESAAETAEAPSHPQADALIAEREWIISQDDPLRDALEEGLVAGEAAGVGVSPERLDTYARAAELIAQADLDSVPPDPAGAVHQVVIGTLLGDPVLATLRRMAQQNAARRRFGAQG